MPVPLELARVFLAHAKGASERGWGATEGLEQSLLALWEAARARWPDVTLPAPDLARHLAERLAADEKDPERALRALNATDLYLAAACLQNLPGALETVERSILIHVPAFLGRMKPSPTFIDEVRQILREKFFVAGPGAAPRIAEYAGQGALSAWVRVAAVRTALNLRRQRDERIGEGQGHTAVQALAGGAPDPELALMQRQYKSEFAEALRAAFAALSSQQRNLLRLHFVGGLTGDQIAALFGVTRSTQVRWLAAAREAVFAETRRLLRERLPLTTAEFDSLAGLLHNHLDVSLAGLLATSKG